MTTILAPMPAQPLTAHGVVPSLVHVGSASPLSPFLEKTRSASVAIILSRSRRRLPQLPRLLLRLLHLHHPYPLRASPLSLAKNHPHPVPPPVVISLSTHPLLPFPTR